jgi:hypothetical protein
VIYISIGIESSTRLNLKEWYRISVTYDGRVGCIYINGNLSARQRLSPMVHVNDPLVIGAQNNQGVAGDFYHGIIAEVRVWQICREENDIQMMPYRRLSGNENGLIGYWPLLSVWDIAQDLSPLHNHGIIVRQARQFPPQHQNITTSCQSWSSSRGGVAPNQARDAPTKSHLPWWSMHALEYAVVDQHFHTYSPDWLLAGQVAPLTHGVAANGQQRLPSLLLCQNGGAIWQRKSVTIDQGFDTLFGIIIHPHHGRGHTCHLTLQLQGGDVWCISALGGSTSGISPLHSVCIEMSIAYQPILDNDDDDDEDMKLPSPLPAGADAATVAQHQRDTAAVLAARAERDQLTATHNVELTLAIMYVDATGWRRLLLRNQQQLEPINCRHQSSRTSLRKIAVHYRPERYSRIHQLSVDIDGRTITVCDLDIISIVANHDRNDAATMLLQPNAAPYDGPIRCHVGISAVSIEDPEVDDDDDMSPNGSPQGGSRRSPRQPRRPIQLYVVLDHWLWRCGPPERTSDGHERAIDARPLQMDAQTLMKIEHEKEKAFINELDVDIEVSLLRQLAVVMREFEGWTRATSQYWTWYFRLVILLA